MVSDETINLVKKLHKCGEIINVVDPGPFDIFIQFRGIPKNLNHITLDMYEIARSIITDFNFNPKTNITSMWLHYVGE